MNDQERAEHDLRSLRRWTARLRWYASAYGSPDLSELDEWECEAFPYEWANIVGRVAKVERAASAGILGPASIAELRGIAEELTDLLPTMQRLRLRLPDLEALKRAANPPVTSPTT
jgi:hypothetical protein